MDPDTAALLERIVSSPHSAGLLGSLLSLRWAGCGWGEKAFAFGFGVGCALWVAPAVVDFVGMQTEMVPRLASFFAGAYGARLGDQMADAVKRLDIAAIAAAAWSRFWPGGGPRK